MICLSCGAILGYILTFRLRYIFTQAKNAAVEQQMAAIHAALPAIMQPQSKLATPEVQHRIRQALAQGYGQAV